MFRKKKKLISLLKSILKSEAAKKSSERIEKISAAAYKIKREIDPSDDRSANELIRDELNMPKYRNSKLKKLK
jgi:hypothetical protein